MINKNSTTKEIEDYFTELGNKIAKVFNTSEALQQQILLGKTGFYIDPEGNIRLLTNDELMKEDE